MEERIACRHCRNPVYPPPSGRAYACPVCGARLPRQLPGGARAVPWSDRIARGSLAAGCLATILAVGWHLVMTPRASTAPSNGIGTAAQRQPYDRAEEERYRYRVHQLEQDLERDPREWGVIVKLAALYARLGVRQQDPARRTADLQRARDLYRLAMQEGVAIARNDLGHAAFQLERIAGRYPFEDGFAEPVPTSDPIAGPSPFLTDIEEMLHARLLWTKASLARHPENARLLSRLGWIYYRLAQRIGRRGPAPSEAHFFANAAREPDDLLQEGITVLRQAARVSPTHEFRAEAYQGLALIYQEQQRWEDALTALRNVVALQPNNWTARERMAAILARLGRSDQSRQAYRTAERWRTSEWL